MYWITLNLNPALSILDIIIIHNKPSSISLPSIRSPPLLDHSLYSNKILQSSSKNLTTLSKTNIGVARRRSYKALLENCRS
jgi:hypothetical protein